MYSSNSTDDQKYSAATVSPPPSASPLYDQRATGIPLSSDHPKIPQTQPGTEEGPWSTGLCGCFDDVPNCCITCWCPCITFGQISEIIDQGTTSWGASGAIYTVLSVLTGCVCCYSGLYRSKMRKQYMLRESPCGDCLVHCFCEHCALCQEYRELKNRGFDMSKGWKGNVERQNYGVAMAPVVEGGMSR